MGSFYFPFLWINKKVLNKSKPDVLEFEDQPQDNSEPEADDHEASEPQEALDQKVKEDSDLDVDEMEKEMAEIETDEEESK